MKLTARDLRKNQTIAEKRLRQELRQRKCLGYRFLRQKPLLSFIADFYCHELKLIIEVDGESHEHNKESDYQRTEELHTYNLKVIRYTNNQVCTNLSGVMEDIKKQIHIITS